MLKHFKNPKHGTHLMHLHPVVVLIMMDMVLYIQENGHSPLITSIIRTPEENKRVGSKTDSHVTLRAFDIRCKDWDNEFKAQFEKHFQEKYKGFGAVSSSTGQENLVEIHGEGDNEHVHVQLSKKYGDPVGWMKI